MSDRSSQPSFAVSRNLKNVKISFYWSTTWEALQAKRGKRHFHFWNFSKYKIWREKVGGTWHIISPHLKKWGGHCILYPPIWKSGGHTSLVSPTKLRPWLKAYSTKQQLPLLGHDESNSSANSGNYTELLNLLSEYDTLLNEHWNISTVFRDRVLLCKMALSKLCHMLSFAILNKLRQSLPNPALH